MTVPTLRSRSRQSTGSPLLAKSSPSFSSEDEARKVRGATFLLLWKKRVDRFLESGAKTPLILGVVLLTFFVFPFPENSNHQLSYKTGRPAKLHGIIKKYRSMPRVVMTQGRRLSEITAYNPNDWKPIKMEKEVPERSYDSNESEEYEEARLVLPNEETGCPVIADWQSQKSAQPNCNLIHEVGLHVGDPDPLSNTLHFIDEGAFRVVWDVLDEAYSHQEYVLKTTSPDIDFEEEDFYDNVRDALIMDQSTSSPYVLNMYGWCSNTGVVERAYGTLETWIRKYKRHVSNIKLLEVAVMLTKGVADMHNFHNGMATMAHADVKPPQYLLTADPKQNPDGVPTIKLNDFNRCAFLTSKDPPEICPFYINSKHRGSTYRSPEEYVKRGPQTDKIDVFSLGSVLYYLLEEEDPFRSEKSYAKAQENIITGVEPELSSEIAESTDPSIQAIVTAMKKCRQVRAEDRPQSREIADFLSTELERIKKDETQRKLRR